MSLKENINSVLKAVGLMAVEVKLEQMKLDDGVTVLEADMFEPGNPVNIVAPDNQLIPLPIGEYVLEDGRILTVTKEGVIGNIQDQSVEEPMPADQTAPNDVPVAASDSPVTPKVVIESIVKEMKFATEVEELKAKVTELEAVITELKAAKEVVDLSAQEPAATPITHNPESAVELKAIDSKQLTKKGRLTEFLNNK